MGLAVNKTYGLFLYYGRDTHQNALICLDGIELQKGKTDVVFSGILIYFVTQFINLQLNVRMYFGASSMYLYFLQKQKYFIIFFILLSFHTWVAVALQQSGEPSLRDMPGCYLFSWDRSALQKPGQMGCHLMRDSILLGFRGTKSWRWGTVSSWHISSAASLCYSKWWPKKKQKAREQSYIHQR